MDVTQLIDRLERFGPTLAAAAATASEEDARWKPPSGAWSILEVVGHLVDEEVDDFRRRLRLTIEQPGTPWPRNDPEAWARDRKYNEQNLGAQVDRFVRERRETVRWLRECAARGVDWTIAYQHPTHGPVHAGTLLVSWPAHDALHLRQIAKRLFELSARDAEPEKFEVQYAGEWGA